MDTKWILKYLTDLSEHNNREWYHAHKAENKEANAQFEELIQTLILRIGEFDTSILHNQPKELTFKLVRDTRFSHDNLHSFRFAQAQIDNEIASFVPSFTLFLCYTLLMQVHYRARRRK